MYVCENCKRPSPPGKKCLRRVVKATNGQIVQEQKLCKPCFDAVEKGIPLSAIPNGPRKHIKSQPSMVLIG